jgi:hypothetical protein
VATVAVPMLACTVTTGGHRGVSAMVSEGRAAGGFRREEVCRGVHWPHVQAQQRERGERLAVPMRVAKGER